MKPRQTSACNSTSFRRDRIVSALLITLALLVPFQTPFAASATIAPVESTVVLDPAGAPFLQGTFQVVSNDQARALTTGKREDAFASATNGELAVYVSNRSGEKDIYYQPLTGGTEVHLSIPGDQRFPTISGDFITFESVVQTGADIFVYDIRTGKLYRVTNDQVDHHLADISVCNGVGRIVYRTISNGGLDAYAFTFQVPSVIEEPIDVVITVIGSFNLPPGTANSLVTKLQTALDAIEASDTATACSSLTGFINECRAQSGKKLTPDQSTQLINSANHIKADLGCP